MATASRLMPATVRSILAPTDFSSSSLLACDFAAALARQFGARLHLAHFVQQRDFGVPVPETYYDVFSNLETEGEKLLHAVATRPAMAGVDASTHLERNEISARINSLVRELHADLMVVASRGRGSLANLALGSSAAEILRVAQAPVLVLGPHATHPVLPFRQLLCATDFSPAAKAALSAALTLTAIGNAGTHLLHVADAQEAADDGWPQRSRGMEARMWAMLPPEARFWDRAQTSIRFGHPVEAILQAATETSADLIAVGAGRALEHPLLHAAQNTAWRVLQKARCPVLVARH
jgi:nucleotide-binding universal stress UspA family protein